MNRPALLRSLCLALAGAGCALLAAPAWADSVARSGESGVVAPRGARTPAAVKLLSWRSHDICPMQGTVRNVRSVDSLSEWRDTLTEDETGAVGRRVLWSREKVVVYAMPAQALAGTQLEPAGSVLRLSSGILWWPVKRTPAVGVTAASSRQPATAKYRPCLIGVVNRAQWHQIRIVERPV